MTTDNLLRTAKFVLLAAGLMCSGALTSGALGFDSRWPAFITWVAHAILSLLGHKTFLGNTSIYAGRFAIHVSWMESLWYLWPIALSFSFLWPLRARYRVVAVGATIAVVPLIAVLRLVTLFIAGAYAGRIFIVLHDYIWPSLLIVLAYCTWRAWWLWSERHGNAQADKPAEGALEGPA